MIFTVLLSAVASLPFSTASEDAPIPQKYQGVWKVVLEVDENGTQYTEGDIQFAERCPIEILIVGNRVVHVRDDGSSVLAYAKVLEVGSALSLDLRTGPYHDKEQSPTYWTLKLKDNRLTIELAIERYDDDPRSDKEAIPSFQMIRQNR